MLVNVWIVIFSIIYSALADPVYLNVGTVLFTPNDIEKRFWTEKDISLLKARRHFQELMPPLEFLKAFNDNNVNLFLEYSRDFYTNVKREAQGYEADTIMTTALSDVLGGYLKVCVLPIAKLNFYGGTVSPNQVIKLFQFYDEIKKYLNADGQGWNYPKNVLSNIPINVNPKLVLQSRSMKDPCQQLAYFENTGGGFGVPLPKINWQSSTLFVPLQDKPLISMNDPSTENILVKYRDVARSCLAPNPLQVEKFDEGFQTWLEEEILPHLRDDILYLSLGSVLTLVNRTRSPHGFLVSYLKQPNVLLSGIPAELSSKKMLIILLILFLEVAWCVPALAYVLCKKKRNNKNKKECSNLYLFMDTGKSDKKDKHHKKNKPPTTVYTDTRHSSFKTFKETDTKRTSATLDQTETIASTHILFSKPSTNFYNSEVQCPSSKLLIESGTGSRSYFRSKNQFCEAEIDYLSCPKNSSFNKMDSKSSKNLKSLYNKDDNIVSTSKEDRATKELVPSKRNRKSKESKNSLKKHSKDTKILPAPPKRSHRSNVNNTGFYKTDNDTVNAHYVEGVETIDYVEVECESLKTLKPETLENTYSEFDPSKPSPSLYNYLNMESLEPEKLKYPSLKQPSTKPVQHYFMKQSASQISKTLEHTKLSEPKTNNNKNLPGKHNILKTLEVDTSKLSEYQTLIDSDPVVTKVTVTKPETLENDTLKQAGTESFDIKQVSESQISYVEYEDIIQTKTKTFETAHHEKLHTSVSQNLKSYDYEDMKPLGSETIKTVEKEISASQEFNKSEDITQPAISTFSKTAECDIAQQSGSLISITSEYNKNDCQMLNKSDFNVNNLSSCHCTDCIPGTGHLLQELILLPANTGNEQMKIKNPNENEKEVKESACTTKSPKEYFESSYEVSDSVNSLSDTTVNRPETSSKMKSSHSRRENRSKIPKLNVNLQQTVQVADSSQVQLSVSAEKRKSMIPQRKKNIVDDTDLTQSSSISNCDRQNVSF